MMAVEFKEPDKKECGPHCGIKDKRKEAHCTDCHYGITHGNAHYNELTKEWDAR